MIVEISVGLNRTGAPNDGFLLNALKAIQGIFRSLEMNSNWGYKICICSVILGELESFQNYHGLSIVFLRI